MVTTYFFYLSQVTGTAKEIVANWLEAEAVNIQQGNLLVAIAKAYRLTNESNNIKGVVVVDLSKNTIASKLFAIGEEPTVDRSLFIEDQLVSSTSLLGQVHVYKLIKQNGELGLSFLVAPGRTANVFLFFASVLSALFLVCFIIIYQNHKAETILKMKFYDIARQACHDIRSPLSLLNVLRGKPGFVSEEESKMIGDAIDRIQDIAEGLLVKSRPRKKGRMKNPVRSLEGNGDENEKRKIDSMEKIKLSEFTREIYRNKKIEYSGDPMVRLSNYCDQDSRDLEVSIDPAEFTRALSNLVNNSIEARGEGRLSLVTISLTKDHERVLLEIRDNGKGIPEERLDSIFEQGGTFDKEDGNGLGLSYAKKVVEQFDGHMKVFSRMGVGTTVRISLPKCLGR